MSEENVEIVRRLYEATSQRDSDAVLSMYDPGVEIDMSHSPVADLIGRRMYHGHDGLRAFFREWYDAWEEVEPDCEELIDAGDKVISVEMTRGIGRLSQASVALPQCGVWTIRDGKVVHVEWLATRAEALEATGLSE